MLAVFSNEERRTSPMFVISHLSVKLKQENRICNVLRSEKNVGSSEKGVPFVKGKTILDSVARKNERGHV